MRRSHLAALMSVSVAALIASVTSSQAVQSEPLVLGLLKPVDSWKVGTVDTQGASFCAMVNKFSSGVGLAFARSPEGYGSVAIDLRDNVFKYDQSYEVTLKTDQSGPRTLPGKATSQRSLVVQIGEDKALYDALKRNGTLQITLDGADISFSLAKFSNSYKSLVTCAGKLNGASGATTMPAVKVKQVEQQALAPIDRELEQLSEPSIGGAAAELAAAEGASSLDEQLEAAANADVSEFKTKVASLDKKHAELSEQIATERDEAAVIEEKKEKVERKLLASVKADKSVKSDEATLLPAATGLTAQELEQREVAASAEAKKALAEAETAKEIAAKAQAEAAELAAQKAAQAAELEQKKAALAALEAEKNAEAERHVAAFTRKEQENAEKAALLSKQADALKAEKAAAAEDNKALKANLVAKQAQLADVAAAREGQVAELTKKLAGTQNEYQSKIASLQGERDDLSKRLAESEAKTKRIQQASTEAATYAKSLEKQLVSSEDARLALETRLSSLEKTASSLSEKQKGLKASVEDAKQLAAVKAELETVKAASAKYQKEITEKTALYTALQGDYAQLQSQGSKLADKGSSLTREHKELTLQLAQKQEQVAKLEAKLQQLEQERSASALKAQAAINDLAAARLEIAGVRKSLVVVENDKLPKLASEAAANRNALSAAEAEIAQLRSEKTAIEQKLAAKENEPAPGLSTEQLAELNGARAEAETLRKANAELEGKLAVAASQKPSKGAKAGLVASQAELNTLRAANADLQQRLAERPAAAPALSDSERAELAENRTRVKELEAQLAVTKMAVPAPVVAAAPVVDTRALDEKNAKLAKAEDEINRLRSEKSSLEQKLIDRASRAAARNTAPAVAPVAIEPDAPEAYIAPVTSSSLAATEPGAGDPSQEMPAVPAAAVEQSHFDDNRAAAFLDSIMAYHRPVGAAAKAAKPVTSAKPVFSKPVTKSYPVKAAPSYKPYVQAQRKSLSPAAAPAYIDEAASLGEPSNSGMTPMPSDEQSFAAPAPVSPGKPLAIEGLLTRSGLQGIAFKPVDAGPGENVRQWTSGDINGMYEQAPASSDFGYAVQSYLDRYREDCQGQLQVKMGKPRTTAAGSVAQADIACPIQSNTYNTSFVFVQGGGTFNAILHTGYPQDATQVKQISDNVAAVIGASGGFAGAQPVQQTRAASLEVTVPASAPAAAPQRRFNIQPEAPAAAAAGDEFETVIVQ